MSVLLNYGDTEARRTSLNEFVHRVIGLCIEVLLGLLINFNPPVLKDGIRRIACGDLFKS